MKETSIETYHQIEAEGLLSELRMEVYKCLYKNGPMTQMETCRKLNNPKRQDRSYMPRFAELTQMGVISSIGEKICRVTGRTVLVWRTTDNLPVKLVKKIKIKCEHCKGTGYQKENI